MKERRSQINKAVRLQVVASHQNLTPFLPSPHFVKNVSWNGRTFLLKRKTEFCPFRFLKNKTHNLHSFIFLFSFKEPFNIYFILQPAGYSFILYELFNPDVVNSLLSILSGFFIFPYLLKITSIHRR